MRTIGPADAPFLVPNAGQGAELRAGVSVSVTVLERISPGLYRVVAGSKSLTASSASELSPGSVFRARVEKAPQGPGLVLRLLPERGSDEGLARLLRGTGLPLDAATRLAGLALLRGGKPADAKAWAGSVAPTVDREKDNPSWLMLRLIQDQNDQTSEIEISIQAEKKLDTKAAMLFYLGEYWYARGRTELASKYLGLSREQRREDCLEYRLLLPEQKRLEAAGVRN